MRLGAVHALTGRQWELAGTDHIWPDVEIVVPFSTRTLDATGTVVGERGSSVDSGGYQVSHRIEQVELRDVVHDYVVPGVRGVWAGAPGGPTARLHLLAGDPFAWLTPHDSTHAAARLSGPRSVEQRFGYGLAERFVAERRFAELSVEPTVEANLVIDFESSSRRGSCGRVGSISRSSAPRDAGVVRPARPLRAEHRRE